MLASSMAENLELIISIQDQVIKFRRLAATIGHPELLAGFMSLRMRLSAGRGKWTR